MINISTQGVNLIKQFEKIELRAYNATDDERRRGIFTIGYGHVITGKEDLALGYALGKPGQTIREFTVTKEEAEKLLEWDINMFAKQMHMRLPEASKFMNQNQIDAVLSLIFNIGLGNFGKSKVLEHLANKDLERAAYFFRSFTRQGEKRLLGLVRRRAVEKIYFQTGVNKYRDMFTGKLDPYEILDLPKEA